MDVKMNPRVAVSGSYHSWWLASTTDNLYAANGAIVARPVAGLSSSHVGQELDLQTSIALSSRVQIGGGYAHIIPGAFLSAATPGKGYSFPYVMVTSAILKGDR